MNEQQAQEQRRQSFFDSFRQDVQLEEVTESAVQEASADAEPMEEMATDELGKRKHSACRTECRGTN